MSSFKKESVSYVIVCYNSVEHLIPCIKSIILHSEPEIEYEIIVVDNSEKDIAKAVEVSIKQSFQDQVRYYCTGRNIGYGAGNNYGIRRARSELIFVINPDVRLDGPVVSVALNNFKRDNKLALIGFSQIGGYNLSFYFYPHIFIPLIGGLINKFLNNFKIFNENLSFPSGACVAIKKSKFIGIGGYDENFFLYCEDADLSRRFVQTGFKVSIDFSVSYKHLIDKNVRKNRSVMSQDIENRSLIYYLKKNNFSISIHMKLHAVERIIKNILRFRYSGCEKR